MPLAHGSEVLVSGMVFEAVVEGRVELPALSSLSLPKLIRVLCGWLENCMLVVRFEGVVDLSDESRSAYSCREDCDSCLTGSKDDC